MHKAYLYILLLFPVLFSMHGCNKQEHYVIGFSQSLDDEWRSRMNEEMRQEALLYDNIELRIAESNNDPQKQISDIEQFIEQKVDVLIASPMESTKLIPSIEKAYELGIPVILVDRKVDSDKYAAYIGADNYNIGKSVGLYICRHFPMGANVVEISGAFDSSPAEERHNGFVDGIKETPWIHLIQTSEADWFSEKAYDCMIDILRKFKNVDVVYAHNDLMAKGAYLAARSINMEKKISFIGIDALDGPDGGSTFVQNGVLMASFIYPSGGGKAIQVAMDILSGKQVQKINLLPTSVVDSTNIQLMALHNTYVSAQRHMVNNLGDKVGEMTEQYTQQQSALHLTIVSLIGAILILAIFIVLYKQRNLINRRLKTQNDTISKQNEMLERKLDEFIAAIKDDQKERLDSSFLAEFDQIISEQMSDPALSVDSISRTMGLSRAGLYRKLKESAGSTPNDYIRSRRLELARRMLLTSDLSISEICYRTGFNTPSYFAKCFKDEFGSLPSEYLEMNKQQRDR